jgi:pilus assembly protein Flp/PilA
MEKCFMKRNIGLLVGLLVLRGNTADRERGATAVEYSLMVALIAGIIVLAVATLGVKVNGLFTTVVAAIP